ncbi:7-cyano-7-deazaguanine synthase [Chlamydiales bacterium STE3]|nr:7-cyano-7-deazaguanine synthase [Chlamydiales bacterium STE3]
MMSKAVVLLSGGLDSTVMLAQAISLGRDCHALTFHYGQKHSLELEAARKIALFYNITQQEIVIDPSIFSNTSLIHGSIKAPTNRTVNEIAHSIPNTYVPARNTLFLAYSAAIAESLDAQEIYIASNANDLHPYPDCRPAYMVAFQNVLNLATKQAVVSSPPTLMTPFLHLGKEDIVRKGLELNVPLHMTWSCYQPTTSKDPCLQCDACVLRRDAFKKTHAQSY